LLKNKLFKNLASFSVVQVGSYVFPLLTIPIITRIIGPDKFGVINYALSFVSYFSLLITYGFHLTAIRRISKEPDNLHLRSKVFSEVFFAQCLLFVLSIILFAISINYIPILVNEKRVAYFSFQACIVSVLTQYWLFQAMNDLYKVAILTFIAKLLQTAALIFFIKQRSDYVYQPLISNGIQILISLASFFWSIYLYDVKILKVKIKNILQLLWNEKLVFFSMVALSFYTTTNVVMLGFMQTETQVGYYIAGQKLVMIFYSVIGMPISIVLFPYIGKAFGQGSENGLNIVRRVLPIIFFFTSIISIILYIMGPSALTLIYGAKFNSSVSVFRILIFIPPILSLSNLFGVQIMMNLNMDKLFFSIVTVSALISVSLNWIMIHSFGFIGVAYNWVATEILITISLYVALKIKKISPIDINYFKFEEMKQLIKSIKK